MLVKARRCVFKSPSDTAPLEYQIRPWWRCAFPFFLIRGLSIALAHRCRHTAQHGGPRWLGCAAHGGCQNVRPRAEIEQPGRGGGNRSPAPAPARARRSGPAGHSARPTWPSSPSLARIEAYVCCRCSACTYTHAHLPPPCMYVVGRQ